MKTFLNFLVRVYTSKNKDLFTVHLGVTLLLGKFGIVGVPAQFLGGFLRGLLGVLIEDGTFLIDASIDAYREGQKLEFFKVKAKEAYDKAMAKTYDEAQKQKIRQQYLDIVKRIGVVGNGPK